MITQGILDFLARMIAGAVALLPPFPPEAQEAIAGLVSAAAALGPTLSKLAPLVPFAQLNLVLSWLPPFLAFALLILGLHFLFIVVLRR